jgi:imidazole glycerol-phosphate synthase subunit HisH
MIVGIVNYNMGNIGSVKKKIERIGYRAVVGSDAKTLSRADKLLLPGVGHFAKAVVELKQLDLMNFLNVEVLIKKKPILGICLGMQLMAKYSEEGNALGFGWFDAKIIRFRINNTLKYKVPHMGWNTIQPAKTSYLLDGIVEKPEFYFVHAYHAVSNNPDEILATTTYDYDFVSAFEKENIFGLQFHPEKSHDTGEKLLSNFLKL